MKRIIPILLAFLLSLSLGAAPRIVMLTSGDTVFGGTTFFTETLKVFAKDYPGVVVEQLKVDTTDGSTLTIDAQIRAGTAPNLYIDTAVRVSKYIIPEYALPLDGLIRDLDKYAAGVLDPYRRGGKLLALPNAGSAQGMCINLDIMRDIGYTVPPNWTIADFLKMAELVKQKYDGKKWATGMFAGNQSGDYLLNNWFAAFGVSFYGKGNYDRSVIADTGGAKVYRFYQDLVRAGYVPPHAATLNDDDYAASWAVGNLAATAFFAGWTKPYFETAISQGLIKEPFKYIFVPFPRDPSVKNVPTYYSGGILVAHKTGTAVDKMTARLMEYLNSAANQGEMVKYAGNMANRTDVTFKSADPRLAEIAGIVSLGGIQDVGLVDPRFTQRRSLQFPILQEVLNLKIDPETAIRKYQDALSAVKE